jgi:uncharacterized CHY-type Zn-finger protein
MKAPNDNKGKTRIYGTLLDQVTRCIHYNTIKDIIAIKFKCCEKYYPCIYCHNEAENHEVQVWLKDEFYHKAVYCGECKSELTITEYLNNPAHCPKCQSIFNPNCSLHKHFYFEI